ncbi:hypothetical protein [Peristeroidobacter soli]|uniref:hypothetical protein n=1 Tax=Peristeroidobacter soli TaxID=2497877 RepID=UPI00101CA20D|nr:hypothetical protein [Peristeroidobacter soli]
MSIARVLESSSGRIVVLWSCVALFLLRVLGQLEVLLLAPPWLPSMHDWYSGLIPYPILLPLQIALLMLMSAVVMREMQAGHRARGNGQLWLRRIAVVYFAVMLLRLIVQFQRGAGNVIDAGGIPVAFHWVLALFLLVLGRRGRLACPPAQKGEAA